MNKDIKYFVLGIQFIHKAATGITSIMKKVIFYYVIYIKYIHYIGLFSSLTYHILIIFKIDVR